jgi:hypothetical protein
MGNASGVSRGDRNRKRSTGEATGPGADAERDRRDRSVRPQAHKANPVYAARYRHLTTRENNKLTPTQAKSVIAAGILRHLYAVITTGTAWDPSIATHGTRHRQAGPIAA